MKTVQAYHDNKGNVFNTPEEAKSSTIKNLIYSHSLGNIHNCKNQDFVSIYTLRDKFTVIMNDYHKWLLSVGE